MVKMDIERIVEIPEGVEVKIGDGLVSVKSGEKEAERKFNIRNVKIEKEGNKIKVSAKKATKREGRMIGTICGHIQNMIHGLKEDFVYKLEICNVHFPMNVSVENDKIVIKNFLGETIPRKAKILAGVKVEISGNEVTVSSHDKEAAGQTAGNIEKTTKLKTKDRRVFQDGIFLVSKAGKDI